MTLVEDELFLMANLFPKRTGLPFTVWISTGQGDMRVKVSRGTSKVTVIVSDGTTLCPRVWVLNGKLSPGRFDALRRWIELNRETLLAYWNEEIDTVDALESLKRID